MSTGLCISSVAAIDDVKIAKELHSDAEELYNDTDTSIHRVLLSLQDYVLHLYTSTTSYMFEIC
jgi:hypothetical protein